MVCVLPLTSKCGDWPSRILMPLPLTITAVTHPRFEVRLDVGYDGMRWITVGPADQPVTSIVLRPPAVDLGITDDERRTIIEMHDYRDDGQGHVCSLLLATGDLDGTFEQVQASGAEIVQPHGVRDCDVRDPRPAGNLIRIQELR
jgi:hypothetical protein